MNIDELIKIRPRNLLFINNSNVKLKLITSWESLQLIQIKRIRIIEK